MRRGRRAGGERELLAPRQRLLESSGSSQKVCGGQPSERKEAAGGQGFRGRSFQNLLQPGPCGEGDPEPGDQRLPSSHQEQPGAGRGGALPWGSKESGDARVVPCEGVTTRGGDVLTPGLTGCEERAGNQSSHQSRSRRQGPCPTTSRALGREVPEGERSPGGACTGGDRASTWRPAVALPPCPSGERGCGSRQSSP